MNSPILMRVLASCVHLASRASVIVRNVRFSKNLHIVDKGVNDLQSKADRDSQRCIIGSLNKNFPGLRVIGEEGQIDVGNVQTSDELDSSVMKLTCPGDYSSTKLEDLMVWVDPLDGTKEFTEGIVEHVTILIGLAVGGKPVAGVIAQPFYRSSSPARVVSNEVEPMLQSAGDYSTRVIWGMRGLGVFGSSIVQPLHQGQKGPPYPANPTASKTSDVTHRIVVTRSHPSPELASVIKAFEPVETLRKGGLGYKVILLLEGVVHAYVLPGAGSKRWDTCAPEAVLEAAGGQLTDILGNHYDYGASEATVRDPMNWRGVLATPIADWLPAYARLIPKEVKDALSSSRLGSPL